VSETRYTRVRACDMEGLQHGEDEYWFRSLAFGQRLFRYLAYVPPGGFMPHGHEEDPYELSFVMLQGELEVMLDGDTLVAASGDAVHVEPTVSLGVRNTTNPDCSVPPDVQPASANRIFGSAARTVCPARRRGQAGGCSWTVTVDVRGGRRYIPAPSDLLVRGNLLPREPGAMVSRL
jgi:quercetin dioxygenase-like cupin family protein